MTNKIILIMILNTVFKDIWIKYTGIEIMYTGIIKEKLWNSGIALGLGQRF